MHGMPSRSFKEMISILQQFVNFSDMVVSLPHCASAYLSYVDIVQMYVRQGHSYT